MSGDSDNSLPWNIRAKLAQLRALPHRCSICDTPPDEVRIQWLASIEHFAFIVTCHGKITFLPVTESEAMMIMDPDNEKPAYFWFGEGMIETDAGMGRPS